MKELRKAEWQGSLGVEHRGTGGLEEAAEAGEQGVGGDRKRRHPQRCRGGEAKRQAPEGLQNWLGL